MYLFYLILIILSSAGIVFVLVSKIMELKTGKSGPLGRLSASADPVIKEKVSEFKDFCFRINPANAAKVWSVCVNGIFHLFGTTGLFISKHYSSLKTMVGGKKFLKGGGIVSFFLKNVAESKEEEEKKD